METSKVQERLLAKLKATDKSVVGKQKETWVATAANEWQACWLKEAINKEITQPMSGKITGRTKVRKRWQRGTGQQQRSWSWQTQVHSEILQLTTKTQKTYCGDALKIRTQSACLGCPHPPKTPLHSSSGTESQAQAETVWASCWDHGTEQQQPSAMQCNCGTPAVRLTTAIRHTFLSQGI